MFFLVPSCISVGFCLLIRCGPKDSSESGSQENLERSSLSMEDSTPDVVSVKSIIPAGLILFRL